MSTSAGTPTTVEAHARRPISIRLLVAMVVVLPVAAVSAALVVLSSDTSTRIAESMADTLALSAAGQVREDVATFLGHAIEVSDRYDLRVREGRLPASGDMTAAWRRPMFDDLTTTPSVASICFGNDAGDSTWLLRGQNAPLELGASIGARDCEAVEYAVDPKTAAVATEPIRVYRYDPRARPWYEAAMKSSGPRWTPIYFWFGQSGADRTTSTGYTRVVRDGSGKVLGVLVIDVTLRSLSDMLARLPIVERGFAFIIDDRGLLVAASRGRVNSPAGNRLRLDESDDDYARGVSRLPYLTDAIAGATEPMHPFDAGREPARAMVRTLSPAPGINWRVIVGAPESTFLSEARALQRRQIVMASIVVGGSVLLALLLGGAIIRPLLKLTNHVRHIGRGDLSAQLKLDATREFQVLSHELNRMSSGLKERIELERAMELAMEVQQSLLPPGVPEVRGLDVAAHCRYCDVTGGDYYDFIDVTDLPEGRTLIAVGDALGHGIASALLMATARAALRASAAAPGPISLGDVMVRVNTVLSHGARQGRFMTMLLIIADPATRTVRWARAGHDPVMIYDPSTDGFIDLDEGSIPLGIESVEFEEYRYDELAPGTILVAGTDGLWEAMNPAGEMFGRGRLRDVVRAASRGEPGGPPPGAAEIVSAIDRALTEFVDGRKIKDDVTLVVMRVLEAEIRATRSASQEARQI